MHADIKVRMYSGDWQVKFTFPDLDTKSFEFKSKEDALVAIKLAQFFRDNEIAIKDINVEGGENY